MERETASQRCPRCRTSFRTLADEVGDHDCPRCGLTPWDGETVTINVKFAEEDEDDR